jgi:uncharacterized protein (DUF488 family)
MIFTVGHSTHSLQDFVTLLKKAGITAIADVRSAPYSRYQPQFNREALSQSLADSGIQYVFVGDLLGGRSPNPEDYFNGRVVYSRLKSSEGFAEGIQRVIMGSHKFELALMCTEKEPLDCHRTLLVAQALTEQGVSVSHIHNDAHLESHEDALSRLLRMFKLEESDLFQSHEDLVAEAILKQENKVAYKVDDDTSDRGVNFNRDDFDGNRSA